MRRHQLHPLRRPVCVGSEIKLISKALLNVFEFLIIQERGRIQNVQSESLFRAPACQRIGEIMEGWIVKRFLFPVCRVTENCLFRNILNIKKLISDNIHF